jgi:predicted HNH restriction endonuclease
VEAHHVIALAEGGSNDAATNGQALCWHCHRATERGRLRASRST